MTFQSEKEDVIRLSFKDGPRDFLSAGLAENLPSPVPGKSGI